MGPRISASNVSFLVDSLFSACKEVLGRTPKGVGAKASEGEAEAATAKANAAAANFMMDALKARIRIGMVGQCGNATHVTGGSRKRKKVFNFNIRVSDISHNVSATTSTSILVSAK